MANSILPKESKNIPSFCDGNYMKSNQKRIKKPTISNDIVSEGNSSNPSFYIVETSNRTFFAKDKNDIFFRLKESEKSYIVKFVEYVGDFEGKEDVICVTSEGEKVYETYMGTNKCLIYDNIIVQNAKRKVWRIRPYNTLETYYNEFKKMGVKLNDDIYQRDKMLRQEIINQMK